MKMGCLDARFLGEPGANDLVGNTGLRNAACEKSLSASDAPVRNASGQVQCPLDFGFGRAGQPVERDTSAPPQRPSHPPSF